MKIKLSCIFCSHLTNLSEGCENVYEQFLSSNVFFIINIGIWEIVKYPNHFFKHLIPVYKSIMVLKLCVIIYFDDMKFLLSNDASFRLLDSHTLLPNNF